MRIPVVYSTDNNYLFYTIVSITSLCESANDDTEYIIYILLADDIQDNHHLINTTKERFKGKHKIVPMHVDNDIFSDAVIVNSYITKAAYYRLVTADILPENKCIYLDSDTIIMADLTELYCVELSDNLIGGCRDVWIDETHTEEQRAERAMKTGLDSLDQYINSGVLLLDLSKIREEGLTQVFLREMKKGYLHEDQDVINVCCYNRIWRLEQKWNYFTTFANDSLKNICPAIIHYATPVIRPWLTRKCKYNDVWWNFARLWKDTAEFQDVYDRMTENEITRSYRKLLDFCNEHKRVVVWGGTVFGCKIAEMIRRNCIDTTVVICDKDVSVQKRNHIELPVLSPTAIFEETEKRAFVIVAQKGYAEISAEIKNNLGDITPIFRVVKRDELYYKVLSDEYYDEEMKDKELLE